MTNEYLDTLGEVDEDVILEGSELYQALVNAGCTDFNAVCRVETKSPINTPSLRKIKNEFVDNFLKNKVNLIYLHIFEDTKLKNEILQIILEGNILLDDHLAIVNDFFNEQQISIKRKIIGWIPFITSIFAVPCYTLITRKPNTISKTVFFTVFFFYFYKKIKYLSTIKNLKHCITLQNKLHSLLKQCLIILRRNYEKKLISNEIHEKKELIGSEKYNVILLMNQLMIEIFQNLSNIYYEKASRILNNLPDILHMECNLTKFEIKNQQENCNENYKNLKSLYYTFILIQSELTLIMSHAYNGRIKNIIFPIPKTMLNNTIKDLTKKVDIYYTELSKVLLSYQSIKIQPIKRVFRGIPNSKWQDVYIHLDLTSQRIQLAYKEILSILESIDVYDEKLDRNSDLTECVIHKMNEAYKQIENARSFAEFSTLLMAKFQAKPLNNTKEDDETENLFPNENTKNNIIINKDPVIEDEVFEEYIKEEYLKPLFENDNGNIVKNFKFDKLLAKSFMIELKDALIEKQKSMNEREINALKRMYDKILNNSCTNKKESEKVSDNLLVNNSVMSSLTSVTPPIPVAPPLPELPPIPVPVPSFPSSLSSTSLMSTNTILGEKNTMSNKKQKIKGRTPIPLPRVKVLQPQDVLTTVERFSINQCIPNHHTHSFQLTEETFLGSGENSEEENSDSDNNDNLDSIEN